MFLQLVIAFFFNFMAFLTVVSFSMTAVSMSAVITFISSPTAILHDCMNLSSLIFKFSYYPRRFHPVQHAIVYLELVLGIKVEHDGRAVIYPLFP